MAQEEGAYPYLAVLSMSLPMLANAYALTSLFPYVGWMVVDLGMTEDIDKAGYYAGYIAASFMLGRFVSSYFWGHMSDIYGRKPIIYISCASIACFSLLFGFSQTFWMAVLSRFLLGLTNGIVAIAKTVASEISTNKSHEASAMGVIIGTWSLGFVIGPGLGGLLARPCISYPSLCGDGKNLLAQFPYLLPNILPTILVLIALPFLIPYLPETLAEEVRQANMGSRLTCFGLFGTSTRHEKGDKRSRAQKYEALAMVPLNGRNNGAPLDRKVTSEEAQHDNSEESGFDLAGARKNRFPILGSKSPTYTIIDEDEEHHDVDFHSDVERHDDGDDDGDDGSHRQRLLQQAASAELDRLESQENEGSDADTKTSSLTSSADDESDHDHLEEEHGAEEARKASLKAPGLLELLKEQCAMRCIYIYSVYSVASIMFDELLPLWALSSVEKGGLAVETKDIGAFLAVGGACLAVFQATIYSRIANRLGSLTALRYAVLVSVPAYFIVPALSRTPWSMTTIWTVLGIVVVFIRCCNAVAFSCISILINNSVPRQHRGSLNGLSMTLGSAAKAIGPVLASILFAWSLHNGLQAPFDYNFVYFLLAILQVLTGILAYKLIQPDSFAEPQR